MTIEKATGGTVSVNAIWGNKVLDVSEWKLTGTFDPQTNQLRYSDCTCKRVFYDEHGAATGEKVEYTDGTGTLQFAEDGSFTWENEQDADRFNGIRFEKLPEAE